MVSINFNNANLWKGLNLNNSQNLEAKNEKQELTLRTDLKLDGFEKTTPNATKSSDTKEYKRGNYTIKITKNDNDKFNLEILKNDATIREVDNLTADGVYTNIWSTITDKGSKFKNKKEVKTLVGEL